MAFLTWAFLVFLIFLVVAATSLFWLWMLIDAIRRNFREPFLKGIWIVVIFFGHVLGAVVYYFAGREQGRLPI